MKAYYGSRISGNMTETPEGYLICLNVPIARTGTQTYMRSELGLDEDPSGLIDVLRTEDEVFAPATIASFEGKPVTDDHPPVGVDTTNITAYNAGHAQNVRRGTGDESDLILADLFITSPQLIEAIRSGRREVSCGYDCDYAEEDGKVFQRSIRGNHIAVVSAGRAGSRVAIKDSAVRQSNQTEGSKKPMAKKHSLFATLFSRAVRDMEPEEVAEAIEELAKSEDEEMPVAPPEPAPKADDAPGMAEIMAALNALTEKVSALVQSRDCGISKDEEPVPVPEQADEDPLEKLEDELTGAEPDPVDSEEAVTIAPEEIKDEDGPEAAASTLPENPIPGADHAVAMSAIRAIKPIIAALPANQRKAASDRAVAEIRKMLGKDAKPRTNGYSGITTVIRQSAKAKANDAAVKTDNGELGRSIMASRNPHYKK